MATIKAIQAKNALNLRPFKYPYYQGQTGLQSDGEAVFIDWLHGIRAGVMDLTLKINNDGLNTIRKIISVFAPASDGNDTNQYVANVSAWTGLKPDQVLTADDQTIFKLFKAMAREEMGTENVRKYLPDSLIKQGIAAYHSNQYTDRITTAANSSVPGGIETINIIVLATGVFMVGRKLKKKKAR